MAVSLELSCAAEQGQLVRGFTYWSDFLDLASCGPVAWRREIEVGISSAAKFVAFIDEDFLLSYNCIMVGGMRLSVSFHNCASNSKLCHRKAA